jgi:hypothetical protein
MNKLLLLFFASMLLFGGAVSLFAGEGHDAGYEWAEQNNIDDPDYDEGNSESFNEGVREYVEEQQLIEEEDELLEGEE